MPRIRTIKPEFWSNEALSSLSESAHMLAASLLNYADDEGYFNANPGLIKAACFPLREPSSNLPVMLQDLSSIGYLEVRKVSDGRTFGWIINFTRHQVISHAKASVIRPFFDEIEPIPVTFHEPSSNPPVTFHEASVLKGREGKGKERNRREPFIAPTLEEVVVYAEEKGLNREFAERYHEQNTLKDWKMRNGDKIIVWKANLGTWKARLTPEESRKYAVRVQPDISAVHR